MNREQFIASLNNTSVSSTIIAKVKKIYGSSLDVSIQKLLSFDSNGMFLDDGAFCRLLSTNEITNAASELHVDFPGLGLIPFFDIEDNNFIVYDMRNKCWKKFNIVDETAYGTQATLSAIL